MPRHKPTVEGQHVSRSLQLYSRLPHGLQGLAVSLQGWKVARSRFGHEYGMLLPIILNGQWARSDYWEELQLSRLRRIVAEARTNVPAYRGRLPEPEGFDTLEALLRAIPLLEKYEVREQPHLFHSRRLAGLPTVTTRTSGTTGAPLQIVHTKESLSTLWAAMERFWRWAGVRRGDRRLSFTGNQIITRRSSSGPFGHHDRVHRRMMMSVYHLGSATADRYLDEIERFAPAFIDGYPSSMVFLGRWAIEHGRRLPVQACFPTAESLDPDQRVVIEQGFQTRVLNQYGSAEGLALVSECPAGSMHVSPEVGIVEILDESGSPAAPGQMGELVLTTLNNIAMPLLRYRIGDRARAMAPDAACACGRSMPVVGEILGRQDDVVVTRDGRRIGMLAFNVFKWTDGIRESQIVQESFDRFIIRIVPGGKWEPHQADVAVHALKERVGHDVDVAVEIVDALPRSSHGKLRAVISEVTT
jgi:phenylacetate-CoA ligase